MRFVAFVTTTGVNFNVRRAIRHHVLSILPTDSGRLAETCLSRSTSVESNSPLRSVQGQSRQTSLTREAEMNLSTSSTDVKDHNNDKQPHDTLFHHDASRSATKFRAFFGALIQCSCKPSPSTVAPSVAAELNPVRSLASRQPLYPTVF